MEFNVFGVVWILCLMASFLLSDTRYILFMVFLSMVLQCNNIVVIGTTGVGVQAVTVAIGLLRLIVLRNQKIERKQIRCLGHILTVLLLVVYLFVNIFIKNISFRDEVVNLSMITVYALFVILLFMKRMQLNLDEAWINKTIDIIIAFVLVVGVFQYLTVVGFSFLRPLLTTLVFNDTQNPNVIFHSKTHMAFYSCFMEPSYCGAFLVGSFCFIAMRKEATRRNLFLIICIALAIVLSRSSTAYGGLAVCIIWMVLKHSKKRSIVRKIVPILILGIITVFIFNYELFDEVIFSKVESVSASVRNTWNRWSWDNFMSAPFTGVGLGQSRASSLLLSLLAELGIIGVSLYMIIFTKNFIWMNSKNSSTSVLGASFLLVAITICQFIACPDLNFSPFWMGMFIQALAINVYNRDLKRQNI